MHDREVKIFRPEYGVYYRSRYYLGEGIALIGLALALVPAVAGAFELILVFALFSFGVLVLRMHLAGRRLTEEEAERSKELHEMTVDELTEKPRKDRTPIHKWFPWMRLAFYGVVLLIVVLVIR